MKKLATTFLALAALTALAASAYAAPLLSEGFSYANGNLVPNGGWATYSGTGTDLQIVSGRCNGNHANAPDDHKLFAVQPNTSTTYACFEVTIPAFVGQPKPVYFFLLKDGGTANFVSRVYVLPVAGGGWTFGVSHTSTSATVGVTPWGTALASGTKYKLVVNYNPVAHTSTLWVNPVNQGSTNVTDTNAAATALAVSGVGIRQTTTASTLPPPYVLTGTDITYSIDNLGVGTTFDDACFQLVTPTQGSTWGRLKSIYR